VAKYLDFTKSKHKRGAISLLLLFPFAPLSSLPFPL